MVLAFTCWPTQLDTFSPQFHFFTLLALGFWARAEKKRLLWAKLIQFFPNWLCIDTILLFFSTRNRRVCSASCMTKTQTWCFQVLSCYASPFTQSSQVFSADGAMRNSIAERSSGGAIESCDISAVHSCFCWKHSPMCTGMVIQHMEAIGAFLNRQSTHELLWFHGDSRRVFHASSTRSLQVTVVWLNSSIWVDQLSYIYPLPNCSVDCDAVCVNTRPAEHPLTSHGWWPDPGTIPRRHPSFQRQWAQPRELSKSTKNPS